MMEMQKARNSPYPSFREAYPREIVERESSYFKAFCISIKNRIFFKHGPDWVPPLKKRGQGTGVRLKAFEI